MIPLPPRLAIFRHIRISLSFFTAFAICSCSEKGGFIFPSDYPADGEVLMSALHATSWVLEDSLDIILTQTLFFKSMENIHVVEYDLRGKSDFSTLDFNSISGNRYMYSASFGDSVVYVVGGVEIEPGHAGTHRLCLKAEDQRLYVSSSAPCSMQDAFHAGRPLPGAAISWDTLQATGMIVGSTGSDDIHFSLESIETDPWADSTVEGGRLTLLRSVPLVDQADSTNYLSSFVARYNFNPNLPCHP